jgi:hypothetical protein
MSRKYNVRVGDKARCKVSGMTGIVTARKEQLFGNLQFIIETHNDAGDQPSESWSIDWQQLELIEKDVMDAVKANRPNHLELGDKVEDRISGYAGIATTMWFWLNGCVHVGVEGPDVEDKPSFRRDEVHRWTRKKKAVIKPEEVPQAKEAVEKKTGGPSMRISRDSIR